MLDFVGTIVTAALMVFVVTALLVSMDISRSAKLTVAGLLGLWIGLAAAAPKTAATPRSFSFRIVYLDGCARRRRFAAHDT